LKKHSYKNYLSVDYTICEISPPLSAICKTRLKAEHGNLFDRNQLKVINKSIFDWNTPVNEQTFIIALEILDNFAHDRIWKNNEKWTLQTRVSKDLKEIKEDLKDELILKTLECYLKMPEMTQTEIEAENREGIIYKIISFFRDQSKADNMFLPTMCFKMFEVVHKYFKNPSFIISDFDSLPNGKIKGLFAPIVTKKGEKSHEKEDFESYLMEFGNVDIFFPVNFRLLQQISRVHGGNSGRVMKSYMFMEEFAKENWTQLKTGYRPLFDDFKNTSFFITK
jgi:SAM-dependent MidA family methyltransferase